MESKEVTKVLDPTVPSMDGDFCCWMITFLWKMVRWLIWWLLFKSIIVVRKYYGGVEDPKALSYSKWSLDHFELRKSADIICVICMYVGYSWVQKSGYQFGHPVQASSHRCEFSRFTSWISSSYKLPCWCNSEIKGIRIQTTSWSFTTYLCFSAPGHIMSSAPKRFFGSGLSAWSAHTQIRKLQGVHRRMPRWCWCGTPQGLVVSFQVSDASSQELADAKLVRNEVSWKLL